MVIFKEEKREHDNAFEVAEGTHQAVLIGAFDIGYWETEFNGIKKLVRKIALKFEIDEQIELDKENKFYEKYNGKNKVIDNWLTLSFYKESRLKSVIESLTSNELDYENGIEFDDFVGVNCLVEVEHSKAGKPFIKKVMRALKNQTQMKMDNCYKGGEEPESILKTREKSIDKDKWEVEQGLSHIPKDKEFDKVNKTLDTIGNDGNDMDIPF